MADLLGEDVGLRRSTSSTAVTIGCSNTNKRCSTIWSASRDLFNVSFDVLLYDLTSTYLRAIRRFRKATSVGTGIRVTTAAMRASDHCTGRDAGRAAARLRGAAGQYRGQHHPQGLSRPLPLPLKQSGNRRDRLRRAPSAKFLNYASSG